MKHINGSLVCLKKYSIENLSQNLFYLRVKQFFKGFCNGAYLFLLLQSLSNSFVFYLTSRLNLNKGSFISHLMSILIIENLPKSWRMNRTHLHSTIALLFLHNEN